MNENDRVRRLPHWHHAGHLLVAVTVPLSLATGPALAWPGSLPLAAGLPRNVLWTLHVVAAVATLAAGALLVVRDLLLAVVDDRPVEQLPLWIGRRDLADAVRAVACRFRLADPPEAGWFGPGQKLDFWLPATALVMLGASGWIGGHLELFADLLSARTLLLARLSHRGTGILLLGYLLAGHLFRVVFLSPTPVMRTFLTGTITVGQLREAQPAAWREAKERDLFVQTVEAGSIAIVPEERRAVAESMTSAAHEALAAGNSRRAQRFLARALRARPSFPPALFLLGETYERLGNPGRARDLLARYLLTNPPEEGRMLATERIRELDRLLRRGLGR